MARLIVFIFCFFFGLQVRAQQIIHIENKRMDSKEEGFSGTAEVSANFVQNINNIFQSVNASQLQLKRKSHSWLLLNGFNYTMLNGRNLVNDGFGHLRFNEKISDKYTFEAFVQGQYNEIIKIHSRFLAGTGVRIKILEKKKARLFFGSLYMREREQEMGDIVNNHHRLSNYVSVGIPFTEQLLLDFIGYYQPDIQRPSDFRFSAEAILDMRLNNKVSFRFAHSLFYDAKPPDGIRNTFYNFRNGFKFEF
jgi:hypothetical protein